MLVWNLFGVLLLLCGSVIMARFYLSGTMEDQSNQDCTAMEMAYPQTRIKSVPTTNANTFGTWIDHSNGSLEFKHVCPNYRRFTGMGLRTCLRDKHIVFVADSLGRYQYLALAYWLENMEQPPAHWSNHQEKMATVESTRNPSVCKELSWGDFGNQWMKFYEGSTEMLGGNEQCDCFRPDSIRCCEHPRTLENRYFTLKEFNVKLSYIQLFGQNELHGHNLKDGKFPCQTGHCDPSEVPLDWKGTLPKVLRTIVKPMEPTHLIVNTGMWWEPKLDNADDMRWLEEVASAGNDVVAPANGVAIWRTTTAERHGYMIKDEAAKSVMSEAGWMIFDTGWLTYGLAMLDHKVRTKRGSIDYTNSQFWNKKHFHCDGFSEMNVFLANLVCPTSAT
jgi:hypothetical protein